MKYAVLGSSSFYGSSFLQLLKENGEECIGLKRPNFDLKKDFQIPKADIIVNFISESSVEESWEDPERWFNTNLIYTNRLFEELLRKDLELYLHVSTPEVYGSTPHWVKEDYPYNPSTPYAVSRSAGDMMLKANWKAKGLPGVISRTSNIYGETQQDYRLIPRAFYSLSKEFPFHIHGKGDSQRSFIHVRDACEGLYKLTQYGKLGETYHISTQKSHTTLQVVRMISEILGKGTIDFKDERLGKDSAYLLNSDKLRKLGWSDRITLQEGLNAYYSAFNERSKRVSK